MWARPRRGALGLRGRIVGRGAGHDRWRRWAWRRWPCSGRSSIRCATPRSTTLQSRSSAGTRSHAARSARRRFDPSARRSTPRSSRLHPVGTFPGHAAGASISPDSGRRRAQRSGLHEEGAAASDTDQRPGAKPAGRDRRGGGRPAGLRGPRAKRRTSSPAPAGSDIAKADPHDDVDEAFRTRSTGLQLRHDRRHPVVREAIPFTTHGLNARHPEHWVLVVRKPLDTAERRGDDGAPRRSSTPPWPALALTLLLGIPLSATIVRRLRRLHHAALQLAADGPPVALPADRRRDEVGDLGRAFDQMQHRLQQQEEARRAFVSTASHELRTPLASLDGMLELLVRRPRQRRSRPGRRALAARASPHPVAPAGPPGRRPARSEPARRPGPAALRAGRARRAEPGGAGRVRAGHRGARDRLDARRLRRPGVGPRRSRGDRADRADPARQRGSGQPPGRRDHRRAAQRRAGLGHRPRRGSRGGGRGARADLRALPARPCHGRDARASGSAWPSAASWPSGWGASSCSSARRSRALPSPCDCRSPPRRRRSRSRWCRAGAAHGVAGTVRTGYPAPGTPSAARPNAGEATGLRGF